MALRLRPQRRLDIPNKLSQQQQHGDESKGDKGDESTGVPNPSSLFFLYCEDRNDSFRLSSEWIKIFDEYDCRMGSVELELYWKHAPVTCCNFAELSRRGYYNGLKFHRIIKDFMIQGGDPTGTGSVNLTVV